MILAMTIMDQRIVLECAAQGLSLQKIAAAAGCSHTHIFDWCRKDAAFAAAFAEARAQGLEVRADELLDMADDPAADVMRLRVKAENYRWLLSKRKPKEYGDRLDVNVAQTVDITLALNDARRRLARPLDVLDVVPRQLSAPDPFAD